MTGQPDELRASSREEETTTGDPVQAENESPKAPQPADSPTDVPAEAAAEVPTEQAPEQTVEETSEIEVPVAPVAQATEQDEIAAAAVESAPPASEATPIPAPQQAAPPVRPPSAPPPDLPMQAPAPPPLPTLSAPTQSAPAVSAEAPAPPAAGPVEQPLAPAAPPEGSAAEPAAPASPGAAMPGLPPEGAESEGAEEEVEYLDPAEAAAFAEFMGETPVVVASLQEGDRRTGVVVSASDEGVVVDVGGKTEGILSSRTHSAEELQGLEPGAEVDVYVAKVGEPGEYAQLGIAREENVEAWNELEEIFREKRIVTAKVIERVKGGLTVDVGVPAFLPGSQVSLRAVQDLDSMIGEEFPVVVVKLSRRRGNVVVSRRELLEKEVNALKEETLAKIEVGGVVTGTVKNVTSYGAFVDLGGIDGLIHVTDISYGRIKDPSDELKPGQEVTAKVVRFDADKERVSLSLKDMEPDPWKSAEERIHPGDKVKGQVASITDYGVFVELEPGVEGLIHITELTWSKRLKHPSKVVKDGEELEAVVIKVQPAQRRISLSLRKTQPDPWEGAEERYPMGAIVEGRIRNVTSYGAFVEVEEGVDGLVHVSDLSWDSRVRNPKDVIKKGQQLKAVVLSVDVDNRRMSLGVKQLEADVWERFFSMHMIGEVIPGTVTRQAKFGVFVEVAPGVEGLCHSSETPRREKGKKGGLQTGETYEFEIIKLDELEKRIGLRCNSLEPVSQEQVAGAGG